MILGITDISSRCSLSADYWDTDTADADASIKILLPTQNFDNVTTNFIGGGN